MVDTSDIRVDEDSRSRIQSAVDLLAEYKVGVYLTIICLTVLIVTGKWQIPSLQPWQEQTLTGFTLLILPSIILGKKVVVEKFLPDNRYNVVEIDPMERMAVRGYKVGPRLWETREPGEFPAFNVPRGNIDYVVTDLVYHEGDEDNEGAYLSIEGCNPEIANPTDILAMEGKLEEVYGTLLKESKQLTQTEATLESKALEIDKRNVNALIEAVEHSARFDSDALGVIQSEPLAGDGDEEQDTAASDAEPDDRPTLAEVLSEDVDPRLRASNGDAGGEST